MENVSKLWRFLLITIHAVHKQPFISSWKAFILCEVLTIHLPCGESEFSKGRYITEALRGIYWYFKYRPHAYREPNVGLLPDTSNYRLLMHRECRERFPRHHRLAILTCITARVWVTHVPWCLPVSRTIGLSQCLGKRSRPSRCMRNLQFYVSGKRPMAVAVTADVMAPSGALLLAATVLGTYN